MQFYNFIVGRTKIFYKILFVRVKAFQFVPKPPLKTTMFMQQTKTSLYVYAFTKVQKINNEAT